MYKVARMGALALAAVCCGAGADPTFLRRSVVEIAPRPDDLTAGATGASYQPFSARATRRRAS
jgi:hypothetical protein